MTNIKKSIVAGAVLGSVLTIYLTFKINLLGGLAIGFLAAIFGAIIFYIRFFSKMDEYAGDFTKVDRNTIIYHGMANHFKDGISVGGTLFLSRDRLIFQSNLINFMKRHEKIISIENIKEVKFEDSLSSFKNGLAIITESGSEDFIVNKRNIWIEHIKSVMPKLDA